MPRGLEAAVRLEREEIRTFLGVLIRFNQDDFLREWCQHEA
jgi:hypothetical protein